MRDGYFVTDAHTVGPMRDRYFRVPHVNGDGIREIRIDRGKHKFSGIDSAVDPAGKKYFQNNCKLRAHHIWRVEDPYIRVLRALCIDRLPCGVISAEIGIKLVVTVCSVAQLDRTYTRASRAGMKVNGQPPHFVQLRRVRSGS